MNSGNDIALEFNEFSKNYTNDMIGCVPHYLQLVSSFVEHLPVNFKPSSILDLGCGNGNITAQLLPYFPNATYTLVDASAAMIDLCRNQFDGCDLMYSNTYFKDFHFKVDTYDLVVAGFSLHHCEDEEKQSMFKNINASLKKGGLFACSDLMISKTNPDHPKLIEQWGEFVNVHFPNGEKWAWIMDHYKAFDRPTDYQLQIEWLKNAGFTDIQMPFKQEHWVFLQALK